MPVPKVNTTDRPREVPDGGEGARFVVNTSRVLEEDLEYVDEEAEVAFVVPTGPWCALVDGDEVPLVCWAVLDSGEVYGVVVGEDGKVDVNNSVEELDGFQTYRKEK